MLSAAEEFSRRGFAGFRDQWQARDVFAGRPLKSSTGELTGVGRGVDELGNYLIEVDGRLEKVRAGEISLRAES